MKIEDLNNSNEQLDWVIEHFMELDILEQRKIMHAIAEVTELAKDIYDKYNKKVIYVDLTKGGKDES